MFEEYQRAWVECEAAWADVRKMDDVLREASHSWMKQVEVPNGVGFILPPDVKLCERVLLRCRSAIEVLAEAWSRIEDTRGLRPPYQCGGGGKGWNA